MSGKEEQAQYRNFLKTTDLVGEHKFAFGLEALDNPELAICPHHHKVCTRVCIYEDCGENIGCVDCAGDHEHGKAVADPNPLIKPCPIHPAHRMFMICVDPLCRVPQRLCCVECLDQFHMHRPLEFCERHRQRYTKLCISKECKEKRSAGCDDCVRDLHNHDKQDLIDVEHFKALYLEVYEMPQTMEEIRYEKATLISELSQYFRKTKTALDSKLVDSSRYLQSIILNYKYGNLGVEAKESMDQVRNNLFPKFSPEQVRAAYSSMVTAKKDAKPVEEIKMFCEQLVELRKMITELDRIASQADSCYMFRTCSPETPPVQNAEKLKMFLEKEEKKWRLGNIEEAKQIKLLDNRPTEVIDTRQRFEERIRQKMDQEFAESEAGSISKKGVSDTQSLEFEGFYSKAEQLYRARKYQDALEMYAKALKIRPDNCKCHNSKGVCYYSIDDYTNALKCYEEALRLDQNYTYAWNNKGNVLSDMGRFDDAIVCYQKSIKINPNDSGAYNGMGIAYYGLHKYEEALKNYRIATEKNPKYANAFNNIGNTYYTMGEYENALKNYEKAIECDSSQKLFAKNKQNALDKLKK